MPLRPSRLRLSHIPNGIRIRPAKNGAGSTRNARIPTSGLSVVSRSVTGSKKSQKAVAEVTITTPTWLTQLLDRWMIGDSQFLSLRSDWFGVMILVVFRGSCLLALPGVLLLPYRNAGQEGGVHRCETRAGGSRRVWQVFSVERSFFYCATARA